MYKKASYIRGKFHLYVASLVSFQCCSTTQACFDHTSEVSLPLHNTKPIIRCCRPQTYLESKWHKWTWFFNTSPHSRLTCEQDWREKSSCRIRDRRMVSIVRGLVIYIPSQENFFDRQDISSHHIWLRDHCRCSECFHSITKQRLVNTFDVSFLSGLSMGCEKVLIYYFGRFPWMSNLSRLNRSPMVLK